MLDSFENTVAKLLDGVAKDAKAAGSAVAGVARSAGRDVVSGWKAANKFVGDHPLAFVGVATAFDAVAVIGGAFAIVTLGAAAVGTFGLIAIGAGVVLLAADGTHFGLEVAGQKFAYAKELAEREEHWPPFETVQFVAPILCLPDLLVNTPRAIREVGEFAEQADKAKEAASAAAETTEKAEDRLQNYIQKRESDPAHPVSMTRILRYKAQISKTEQTLATLLTKSNQAAKDARNHALNANFAGIGISGTAYGYVTMAAHTPNRDGYVKNAYDMAKSSVAAGWYDLGSWFAPTPPTYPIMPDAGSLVYHRGFRGGYFSRVGDDPWSDMQSCLSIHIATTRVKTR